ncbi:MAG: CehA/McbA family metallohydrolase [Holophaga sp.]|nr:CehA/McbA family metallohydrolase [Holophaga sp.]
MAIHRVALLTLCLAATLPAQWINHHPTVKGYRAHHYFEGYELPIVSNGPMDISPAPDGKSLVFSTQGWLWRYDLATAKAERITLGGPCDSRPTLSPDGRQMAFVRDDNTTMWIVLKDLRTGIERDLVKSGRLDLDPVFAPDGHTVYYSSSEGGDVDLWKVDLATGKKIRLTTDVGLEMRPQPLPDGKRVVYLHKTRPGLDQVRLLDLGTGAFIVLQTGAILSQTRPALSPDGCVLALNLPHPGLDTYHLAFQDLDKPYFTQVITQASVRPLAPTWSADQHWVYFSEDTAAHGFALKRVPAIGGAIETLPVLAWQWNAPTTTVRIETGPGARVEVRDAAGHPYFPKTGVPHYDWQSGRTYFHAVGSVELTVPVGELQIMATRGFSAPAITTTARTEAGQVARVELAFKPMWNARAAGWWSADTHWHINYGGPYVLHPNDAINLMRAEDLDLANPMAANLNTRYTDPEWLGWEKKDAPPLLQVSQETRNHFLGHLGLIQTAKPFWPWFYGPGYPMTDKDDISNGDVLRFGRKTGAFVTYMHPFGVPDPFSKEGMSAVPCSLVADAVLGNVDGIELSCLWVNELGVAALWYRLLNLGLPVVATGGSDAFMNFYRCSTPGSNRVYVKMDGPCTWEAFYTNLRKGRSVVSSGPMLVFKVAGQEPGGALNLAKSAPWTLEVHSPVPVNKVEIMVNGQVVETLPGLETAGSRSYSGKVKLPSGGWIAARVHDERSTWPVQNSRTFAHAAPVWIGSTGSTEPTARKVAAQDLLRLLDVSRTRLDETYAPAPIPNIKADFDAARAKLLELGAK